MAGMEEGADIEHRGLDETLARTTRSHLRCLEATVEEQRRDELRRKAARPFTLADSIVATADDAGDA